MSAISGYQPAASGAAAAPVDGLVKLLNKSHEPIQIETAKARLEQMRFKVMTTAKIIDEDHLMQRLGYRPWMVTLTYRNIDQQKPSDVARFLNLLRTDAIRHRRPFRYLWVGELQERGALHYHLLIWYPRRKLPPKFDSIGYWPHGMTERSIARNPLHYLTKYASKLRSKCGEAAFPKGFRMHGFGGLPKDVASFRRWKLLPKWARDLGGPDLELRPAQGGGKVSKNTGECFESPWEFVGISRIVGIGTVVSIRRKQISVIQI